MKNHTRTVPVSTEDKVVARIKIDGMLNGEVVDSLEGDARAVVYATIPEDDSEGIYAGIVGGGSIIEALSVLPLIFDSCLDGFIAGGADITSKDIAYLGIKVAKEIIDKASTMAERLRKGAED